MVLISIVHQDSKTQILSGFQDTISFASINEGFLWIKEHLPIYKATCDRIGANLEITFYGTCHHFGHEREWTQDGYFEDKIPKIMTSTYTIKSKCREVTTKESVFPLNSEGQKIDWTDNPAKFYPIAFHSEIFN